MGNRTHASMVAGSITVLLLVSAVALLLPAAADAASLTDQVKKRLCDRQERLAGRLARALINPSLCDSTPTPEPTLSFTADPSEIEERESSTLSWSTTNATSCTASGGWSDSKDTSGSEDVSPEEDTTYTLTCSGAGGDVSKSVTVSVDEDEPTPTPTLDFDADPTEVTAGGTTTLTWDSSDATSCVASNGWSDAKALDGSEIVTVDATTTYTLACGNGTSTSTESVTVDVVAQPAVSVDISADPSTITEGDSSELTWNSENATSCVASNGWSDEKALDGTEDVSPTVTTTYALECTGPGGTAQDSVTVTVNEEQDEPEVNLSADPLNVTPGEGSATSTLTWTTSDADLCLASGGWSDSKPLSGSQVVEPNATTTYTLECSNEVGTTTDSVTVNFVPEEEAPESIGLVISEVYYDVASTTSGSESSNEWVELYNGTDAAIDLQGWFVGDAIGVDEIDASFVIEPGEYAVIAASTTPEGIPEGVAVFVLSSSIGSNGFTNAGDAARLLNDSEEIVDQVGYGTDETVSPNVSIPEITDGHSIARVQLTSDTDTAADWEDTDSPNPGE